MDEISIIGLAIIIANGLVSYQGLKSYPFLDQYSFQVDEILINKDYKRLVTSGFLHVSWTHWIFNMITFYCFSYELELSLGAAKFLTIYFGSLVGGNLFSLYIHRNHPDYSAVGASGAISGIVFASIALFPGMEIGFFGLSLHIPGWTYGLFYILFSIYGIKSQRDNIGHEAHFGGGLLGLLVAIAMVPTSLTSNYLPIILILLPSTIFIYIITTRPEFLLLGSAPQKEKDFFTVEDKYNSERIDKERELDSLTKKEKEKLKQLSNER